MTVLSFKFKPNSEAQAYEKLDTLLKNEEVEFNPQEILILFKKLGEGFNKKKLIALHERAIERILEQVDEAAKYTSALTCDQSYQLAQAYLLHRACLLIAIRDSDNEEIEKLTWQLAESELRQCHIAIFNRCRDDKEVKLSDEQKGYLKHFTLTMYSFDCNFCCFM